MNEPITKIQLDVLEKAIDKVFNKIGIDVEFTRHFLDRVNDPRNEEPISLRELGQLFVKEYKKWGRQIAKMPIDSQAVMKDLSTALNIPFVINKGKQGKDMIAKTVMRKQNFTTPDLELPVESIDEDRDPFSREVMVPGLGAYTVATLQKNIENKLKSLHARAQIGDPFSFRQIAHLLKDPAFNAMLNALMKTYDKIATQTQHRKAFGEDMHSDTFSNVKSESINDYDIVKTNGKYLLMRSKNDDEYYIVAKKHNKGISAIADGAKVDDNEWEFSSIGKTSQGYGVSYHKTPLEGFAEWTDDMFEDMHGAKKGSQVKGREKTPSKSKPTRGGETAHPLRGRLVGEADVKEMWENYQLTDKIITARDLISKKKIVENEEYTENPVPLGKYNQDAANLDWIVMQIELQIDMKDGNVNSHRQTVPMNKTTASQPWLYIAGGGDPVFPQIDDTYPVVAFMKDQNFFVIIDGHHRIAKAFTNGQSQYKALVFDIA